MSGRVEQDADSIQLHFCQRCGISIPVSDIESGRADPAPGGFVCAGCGYQQKTPEAPVPHRTATPEFRREPGNKVLVVVAMLYVVGATSFLLYREVNRKPPKLSLPNVATKSDVLEVDRKIRSVDDQSRTLLAQLRTGATSQQETLRQIHDQLIALDRLVAGRDEQSVARDRTLREGILEVAKRTLGLTREIPSILEEIRKLEDKIKLAPPAPGPVVRNPPGKKPEPKERAPSAEDQDKKRLVQEYVGTLRNRKASNTLRYNAAVQLGDLNHPDACDPLIEALQKDSYDLVRRAAAWSLGQLGRHAVKAIPVLIEQIGGKEEYVGYMCERALGDITKATTGSAVSFKFDPTMSQRDRRKVQRQWEAWWEKNKAELS